MTKKYQVYKCNVCGNIVEVLDAGNGELVCCGKPMNLLDEKTADKSTEKHVPVIEKTSSGYKVTVGSTLHPMEEKHYIEWIELTADGIRYKKFSNQGSPLQNFLYLPLRFQQENTVMSTVCGKAKL
jgi:superoxide reductase